MTGFFQTLVHATHDNGILLSQTELMENLARWLSGMTAAQNRPFRHTATVISLAVITALCEVGRDLRAAAAKALRHSESEKKAKRVNKDRVSAIRKEADEQQHKQELLDRIIDDWYSTIFIHRYRDIDPRIRVDCATALGDWTVTYPDMFFDDSHLRYLAWILTDVHPPARLEVLKQILRLYKDKSKIPGLRSFTERFRPRIVEMATLDSEASVRIEAVKVLDVLRAAAYLEPDNIDAVGRLIYDIEPRVRAAVAQFFAESVNDAYESKIDDLGGQEDVNQALPDGKAQSNSPSLNWLRFKCLAEMLDAYDEIESSIKPTAMSRHASGDLASQMRTALSESRFVVATTSLHAHIPEMSDWEAIGSFLLYDSSSDAGHEATDDVRGKLKEAVKLTPQEEAILVEVLYMSVTQHMNSLNDESSDRKVKRSKKQREEAAEEREASQRHLAVLLPSLVKRFESEPHIVAILLRLDREAIDSTVERDETSYTAFLMDCKKQFLTHSDERLLDEVSSTLLQAKDNAEHSEVMDGILDDLWAELTTRLTSVGGSDLSARGNMNMARLTALRANVHRIKRLATISKAVEHFEVAVGEQEKSLIVLLTECIRRAIPHGKREDADVAAAEDTLALDAATTSVFYFLWSVTDMMHTLSSASGSISDEQLTTIAEHRDEYAGALVDVLDARGLYESASAGVAGLILDLHTTMATLRQAQETEDRPADYLALALEIDADVQERILDVFGACERDFAKRTHRQIEKEPARPRAERAVDADPVDEDEEGEEGSGPESSAEESDADEEMDEDQARERALAKRTRELRKRLLAEQRLCELTSKIVIAVLAHMMDGQGTRKRLERNKTKLGASFKSVLKWLDDNADDADGKSTKKTKKRNAAPLGKAGANAGATSTRNASTRTSAKLRSNAYVDEGDDEDEAEDEQDDEQQDLESEQRQQAVQEQDELHDGESDGAEEQDIESVLGD